MGEPRPATGTFYRCAHGVAPFPCTCGQSTEERCLPEPVYQTRVTITEQEKTDLALGAALRAALATLEVGASLHIDEQETDGNRVWHMSGPYSRRTDATRALAASLSQAGDANGK